MHTTLWLETFGWRILPRIPQRAETGAREGFRVLMRTPSLWLVFPLMLYAVAPAAAQVKTVNIGVGYQFLRFNDASFPLGANVDLVAEVMEHIALVGEFGWARNSTQQFGLSDVTTGLHAVGGVRWAISRSRRFRPFAQILIGVERDNTKIERFGSDSASALLFQPGGGIVVHVHGRQDLFGQVDLHRASQEGDGTNAVRFLVGLRFDIR